MYLCLDEILTAFDQDMNLSDNTIIKSEVSTGKIENVPTQVGLTMALEVNVRLSVETVANYNN